METEATTIDAKAARQENSQRSQLLASRLLNSTSIFPTRVPYLSSLLHMRMQVFAIATVIIILIIMYPPFLPGKRSSTSSSTSSTPPTPTPTRTCFLFPGQDRTGLDWTGLDRAGPHPATPPPDAVQCNAVQCNAIAPQEVCR